MDEIFYLYVNWIDRIEISLDSKELLDIYRIGKNEILKSVIIDMIGQQITIDSQECNVIIFLIPSVCNKICFIYTFLPTAFNRNFLSALHNCRIHV